MNDPIIKLENALELLKKGRYNKAKELLATAIKELRENGKA